MNGRVVEHSGAMITVSDVGRAIADTCERIFRSHCGPEQLLRGEGDWNPDLWRELVDAGLTTALQPSGSSLGIAPEDALNIIALSGRFGAPVPLPETLLANWLAMTAGLAELDGVVTLAGADRRDAVEFKRSGNLVRISGSAAAVPWARFSQSVLLVASDEEGLQLAIVPISAITVANGENIAREPRDDIMIEATVGRDAIARLPHSMAFVRMLGATMRVLQITGALDEVLGMTIRYASTRVQFGRPISKFQAVQQNIAILGAQIAAARAAANDAARGFGDPAAYYAVAAAKARVSEAVGLASRIAHQVHGAIGITQEYGLHFLTKRLWAWRDEYGNEAEWSRILGQHLLRQGADELWPSLTHALRTGKNANLSHAAGRSDLAAE